MSNSKDRRAKVLDFASELPPTLYWDASFIIHFSYEESRWHKECVAFAARLYRSETISYVSTLALDEVWFNLLQLLIGDDNPDASFWRVVNDNPAVVANYVDRLEKITDGIYDHPRVRVVTVGARTPRRALENMRAFYLLPRDALHLAAMRQHKLQPIVTTDADFLPAPDLFIYTCNPAVR